MMHQLFLQSTSPLYERADSVLHIEPLNYRHYCEATNLSPLDKNTFFRFSLIGGIPRYFSWSKEASSLNKLADKLFFDPSARLEQEPDRLLKDEDPALQFWYGVYSPHRSRWHLYSNQQKKTLFHEHASKVLEDIYRAEFPDAARYWESNIEFDCVRYDPNDLKALIVSEIKLGSLKPKDRDTLKNKIEYQFKESNLAKKYRLSKVEILDLNDILAYFTHLNGR
ncbi:MAG: hypothetical protein JKY15_00405 [Deltaproteobacteria bacterium]|nr:hypothetical protein [Deltaproteobacteria bacterium]